MVKQKKASSLSKSPAEALAQMEEPKLKWKTLAQLAAALVVIWITSLILTPYIGYWILALPAAVTLALIGFGIYVWRLTSRSRKVIAIMKEATDEMGRRQAIEKLSENGSKDAMKALARAQLVAQTKPLEALQILESIDLGKAPAMLQDDIRSQLALLYLRSNRVRDARTVADSIRLDRQPNPKAKAMYAAVVAESFSRSGKADEARKLLETYSAEDKEYGEAKALLLRAQVYTCFALKKRGLVRKAMEGLAEIEPGLLGGFVQKGTQPELMKLAKQVLARSGLAPKTKIIHTR
ncbi:MAG: tetratricopeptide repeat protein [Deltaproteobacteria bacterium]|nr:tetratricopeptide repeat protein [Deltaproteobacteria bacterium]